MTNPPPPEPPASEPPEPPASEPPRSEPPRAEPPPERAAAGPGQPGATPAATSAWPPVLPPAERVRTAWQQRENTDYRFVSPWLNVFLTIITCGIFGLYLFYHLVRRSRDHNRRRLELLDGATTFAWETAYQRGVADELRPNFERIASHLAVLRQISTEFRDPGIWLVLAIFARGIAEIVAFVLLDGDLIKHDRAEGAVEAELAAVYARLDEPLPEPDPARVKEPDNYVGRIVASVLTCGIYFLWWFVDQQRDGDRHIMVNWPWEDALAQAVQNLQAA
jgi:hypothetical protein